MKTKLLSLAVLAALSAPTFAHQAGDIIVRAGVANVTPNESSQDVVAPITDESTNLGEFGVGDNAQMGLNFTYMLTNNIGLELLAATPFTHDVSLDGFGKIAEVTHLPPTLTAQYYFGSGNFRPYVGVGVNATIFFEEEFTNNLDGRLDNLELDASYGLAGQVGFDYKIDDNLLINAAVWYIDIGTDVNFDYTDVTGTAADVPVTIETDIDPWVYMLSVGYSF